MFTQKISMDCTREQYDKYLKDELLKMGYKEYCVGYWHSPTNQFVSIRGGMVGTVHESNIEDGYTYLGSFNAPLFLALAAMTDEKYGRYGEYWVFERKDCAPEFVYGNLYKAITPINEAWCFTDERGRKNSFSKNEKYFRKATVSEIMQKFGEPKRGEHRAHIYISYNPVNNGEWIDILCQHSFTLEKGHYYYCKTHADYEWVFISSGTPSFSEHIASICIHSGNLYYDSKITTDDDAKVLRMATQSEKEMLNKKMAENGKYFDKEKCKIMPIVEKIDSLNKRGQIEINISLDATKLKSEIELAFNALIDSIEKHHIDALKSKGYKILKPKTWEEV